MVGQLARKGPQLVAEVARLPAARSWTVPELWRVPLRKCRKRRGSATIDYFLVVGVVLPLAAIVWWFGPRAIQAVYDMSTVVIAWPFM